jgi:ribose transport system permease protein
VGELFEAEQQSRVGGLSEDSPRGSRSVMAALSQPVWITLAVVVIGLFMCVISPAFRTYDNLYNDTRNFAFIAIMGMGEMLVIITGGIDLSVGSVMGLVGIVTSLVLQASWPLWVGVAAGLSVALLCGFINGWAIARLKLSPFVVTLGMLSVARSQALVISNNKMVYQFGPDEDLFAAIGGGNLAGIPSIVIIMIIVATALTIVLKYSRWGQYVYAIGGNEQAARLTGVPVEKIKISVYMVSSLLAGVAAILMVGWLGAVTNALGVGYELQVIAATVIGGTDLSGGLGTPFGSIVGSALIEIVRNALLLAGVDPYWQGTFVGIVIACAVLLEKLRHTNSD